MKTALSWLLWPFLTGGAVACMHWAWQRGVAGIATAAVLQVAIVAIAMPLERWMPEHSLWNVPQADVLTDALHALVSGVLVASAFRLCIFHFMPSFSLWPTTLPVFMQLMLALLIADVGAFGTHRMFHGRRWLWPFHSAHHAAKRLYWLNASRMHPFDTATTVLASLTPLALLGAPLEIMSLFDAFVVVHITLQHSNIRLRHGWINHLFATAEFHRWHHSSNPNMGNGNYASFLSVLDHIFGTFRMPAKGPAADAIGLQDETVVPSTWWAQVVAPVQGLPLAKRPR